MIKKIIAVLTLTTTVFFMNAAPAAESDENSGTSLSDKDVFEARRDELLQENEILELEIRNEQLRQELSDLVNPETSSDE